MLTTVKVDSFASKSKMYDIFYLIPIRLHDTYAHYLMFFQRLNQFNNIIQWNIRNIFLS